MKIIVNTKELQQAVKNLLKVVPKKSSVPILESIKIEVENNKVLLIAANMQFRVKLHLKEFEVVEPGTVVLSRDTVKLISKLTNSDITITDSSIESGKRIIKYSGMDATKYPKAPKHKYNKEAFELDRTSISKLLDVAYACSTTESTPVLKSVLVRGVTIASTDRHRMALNTLEYNNYEKDIIIPSEVIKLMPAFTDKKNDEKYSFMVDENEGSLQIKIDNVEIGISMDGGTYPDISRIIPQSFKTEAQVNKNELIEELKILKDIVSSKTKIIKMSIEGGKLSLLGENEGNSLTSEINTYVNGENIEININLEYVLDAVQNIQQTDVTLKFTGKMSPMMIDDNALVLPYRIAS